MVHRIYVEKKPAFDTQARTLARDLRDVVGISGLESVRVVHRYDVEGLSDEQFAAVTGSVFFEPQTEVAFEDLEAAGVDPSEAVVFAVESVPGQFDQRSDSAQVAIQIVLEGDRPRVRYATVYVLGGNPRQHSSGGPAIAEADVARIKDYLINPVEVREVGHHVPDTLAYPMVEPQPVASIDGFRDLTEADLAGFIADWSLAMDEADLALCRNYFVTEKRDPTVTEIRVIDTYWSDHCRHTTFNTELVDVAFADSQIEQAYQDYLGAREDLGRTKPITLMDLGTIGAKVLKKAGKLDRLDESEEVNACTVKIDVTVAGEKQAWLLLFKNETHNHPTEIEPFGGASTCVGGAIRDPLSGRGYVYSAMRISGAADPRTPLSHTLDGKLSQRKIVQRAAAGNSSYGNQIGLASSMADEIYHPGYVAKHMELGAVVGAVPESQVIRQEPMAGDLVVLVGGKTGRDGVGGATGSSKGHTAESLVTAGAEVQKGDAPEERKIQRLFRHPDVSRRIKRCNDFGAGGVSVAVGELAAGLDIDLDVIPVKYDGLDGTELATSESQERMALVVAAEDAATIIDYANEENVEATVIAAVTDAGRMRMTWRNQQIVDLSREFLDSNGAPKTARATVEAFEPWRREVNGDFAEEMLAMAGDLNVASKQGLAQRFDSTAGGLSVLMPYGGTYQATPAQAMVHKIPVSQTSDCSAMAWGFNPYIMEKSAYHGAYLAVVESVSKLVATGAAFEDVYLSFQEYFESLGQDAVRWGKPLAALLGALEAQLQLGVGAIGGKDSMSGTFEDITVPPTLVSFAVTTAQTSDVVANHFKHAGATVSVLRPQEGSGTSAGLPSAESLLNNFAAVTELLRSGKVLSAYTPGLGGVAETVMKMSFGERLGFRYDAGVQVSDIFDYSYGSFVLEWADGVEPVGDILGATTSDPVFALGEKEVSALRVWELHTQVLEDVYPTVPNSNFSDFAADEISAADEIQCVESQLVGTTEAKAGTDNATEQTVVPDPATGAICPTFLVPVFPGTNGEYPTIQAIEAAGGRAQTLVVKNGSGADIAKSVQALAEAIAGAQALILPSGASGGDEPGGGGKLIANFLRKPAVANAIDDLLARDGLILGIANGFQALVRTGLLPYGKMTEPAAGAPALTINEIGRTQSRISRVRVVSELSPWLARAEGVYNIPVAHAEGRFVASNAELKRLAEAGQIATQYVGLNGQPSQDIVANPSGSTLAVEGITSADGRIFGRMGHSERTGEGLYRNVPGRYDMQLFESAVDHLTRRA